MSKSQEAYVKLLKDHEKAMEKIADLEEAVYNQGKANAIFEDIRDNITKNEAARKMDSQELHSRMGNAEKTVSEQNFTIEQITKKIDRNVISNNL
jgi:hypothetical protein